MARTEDPISIIVATIESDREMIVKMVTDIRAPNDRGKFFLLFDFILKKLFLCFCRR